MRNIHLLNSRFTLPFAFLLAISLLAVSLLFMLPGGPLHAQTDTIEYAENGTGSVAVLTATDPENAGAIVWSLMADDNNDLTDDEDFEIDRSSGVLSFKESPNYEMGSGGGSDATDTSNTYTVTVVATDADFVPTSKTITVEVTNVDEAGTVTLSSLAPYPGEEFTAELSDPDGNDRGHEWQWSRSRVSNGSYADIEDAEAVTYTPETGDVGYYLRATVTYRDGEGTGKSAMATSANDVQAVNVPNAAPVFPDQDDEMEDTQNTETERTVAENADAGANVGARVTANDANGDILTYTLAGGAADVFEIDPATGQIMVSAGAELDFDTGPNHPGMVMAMDPAGAIAEIVVTITLVDDMDEPPTITGTVPASVEEGQTTVVSFTGTDVDDAGGAINWSLSGPDVGDFDVSTGGVLTFSVAPNYEAPADADGDNVYEVTVVATDADRNRGERAVKINVANVDEPGAVTLSSVQARVGVPLTATLTDPDGGISNVKWQWMNGNSAIDGATSDTYTPENAGDNLMAMASYTDRQGADKVAENDPAVAVQLDIRNKAPVFDDQDDETEGTQNTETERTVAEKSAAGTALNGGAVVATDANTDDELTYTLAGSDASSFDISSADTTEGQITVKAGANLDFETKSTYMVTVIATDSYGASTSIEVTIRVTDENEGPEISGRDTIEYAENGTGSVAVLTATDPENAGAIVWSLMADDNNDLTDDEDFEIDRSSGVLSFKESPNYEMGSGGGSDATDTSNTYTVTVVATDADFVPTSKTITVEVTNVDEAGTVTLSSLAPYPGEEFTAELSDPDGNDRGHEWQWSRSRVSNGSYADIEDAEAVTYTPETGDVGYYLRATVTYRDGEGTGKSAMATSANDVQAVNVPNAAPVFPDQDDEMEDTQNTETERTVAENADAGANVGARVTANDANGDILTYTLAGGAADVFEIDPATGQIMVSAGAELDFDTGPNHPGMVMAMDPAGAIAEIVVTITLVDDMDEPPTITGTVPASVEEGQTTVVSFTGTDVDDAGGAINWSLSGPDVGDFDVSTGGVLTFSVAPNYEAPADADGDNVYEVTVVATDADRNRGERAVKINVANVDEPGAVTLSSVQARVGIPLTATLTDPDGGISNVKWQWMNGNSAIDGATSDTYTPENAGDNLMAMASYTDRQGADKVAESASFTVVADDRNKAPVFDDQDDETEGTQNTETERTVAENAAAGTALNGGAVVATDANTDDDLTYTLAGSDASSFDISSADTTEGQITVKAGANLDFETKSTYMVTVIATDSFGASTSIEVTITITDENEGPVIMVTDVDEMEPVTNEAPVITGDATAEFAEDGNIAMPLKTYTATDPDGDTLTWTLMGADAAAFDITDGALTFMAQPDFEMPASADGDNVYEITVVATDSEDNSATMDVEVTVTNVDEIPVVMNEPPVITGGDPVVPFAENGDITTPLGTYTATDPEGDTLTWTLMGADAAAFDITGGALTFMAQPDFEMPASADGDNVYEIMVVATDSEDASDDIMVTIVVTDVDEVPTIGGDATTDYAENGTGDVATFTAVDPEEATITWSLSGTDAGVFDISGAGVLTFNESPDFEMPADADTDNSYMVTVEASDGTNMASHEVTVTVTNVDDTIVEQTLLDKYDADDSGRIDREEVIAAIDDYLFGVGDEKLTRPQVIEVIDLYLFG